jgi:hypothetical protein
MNFMFELEIQGAAKILALNPPLALDKSIKVPIPVNVVS